jgi:putative transposase
MKNKHRKPEQIIAILSQAEAKLGQGQNVGDICREIGISDATYYNWRRQYGRMKLDQVKQLKTLQKENIRLKKLVADLSLDKAVLKEALRGNF